MIVVLLLLLAIPVGTAAAQALDEGTFSIRQDGREVAREQFVLREGRGRGQESGSTITTTARFGKGDSARAFVAVLQRTAAGAVAAFQYDLPRGTRTRRILAASDDGRLTVRRLGERSESARQWPATTTTVLLADSVFALYAAVAELATTDGADLIAIFPRPGTRIRFTATREEVNRPPGAVVQLRGGLNGRLTLGPAGRLERVDLPDRRISAIRRRR
jgi:hypothetical protein